MTINRQKSIGASFCFGSQQWGTRLRQSHSKLDG